MSPRPPLVVEVTRGALVESHHLVSAAAARDGETVAAWGDVEALVYPRSVLKPLQALPLVLRGADPGDARLALACASHNGEPVHVEGVLTWLAEIGLPPEALECGAHEPIDAESARAMIREGAAPGAQHNNCSGKHCGFLRLAQALGADPRGYIDHAHPVQAEVRRVASGFLDLDLDRAPWGVDGCGIPTYGVPLTALARAFSRLPGTRVFEAMAAQPYLVAGRNRFDTAAMWSRPGQLIVKGGAEGVCAAALKADGTGVALKVHDGGKRAADIAMAALIGRPETSPVLNAARRIVGEIRVDLETL